MKKRIIALMAVITLVIFLMPGLAFAENESKVGEYVFLSSGGFEDVEGGSGNEGTLTEEERQAAAANNTLSKEINAKVGNIIKTHTIDKSYRIETDGYSYTYITDLEVTSQTLKDMIDMYKGFNPIGSGFNIGFITPALPNINESDVAAFSQVINGEVVGNGSMQGLDLFGLNMPFIDFANFNWLTWPPGGFGTVPDLKDWLIIGGGEKVRVDIDGGFIDFPNVEKRYEMLDAYLNASGSADTIRTQYIVEYRIENTAHETLYRIVGKNGANSYTWTFINNDTGESYTKGNLGENIFHQFMRAGLYTIDIDKEVYKTFCDSFTFSVNEYWIVADTGQVIWKRETKGKDIDPSIPASEHGFKNMVIYNIPDNTAAPSIETINVATLYQAVTEDMLGQSIPAEGSFRTFYTERIQ